MIIDGVFVPDLVTVEKYVHPNGSEIFTEISVTRLCGVPLPPLPHPRGHYCKRMYGLCLDHTTEESDARS